MAEDTRVASAEDLPPGSIVGAGQWAVGNAEGTYFAVSRRCRHLRADLANGTIDDEGCLVCPWHGARYDVASGQMITGPQGAFAKVPGLGGELPAPHSGRPTPDRDGERSGGHALRPLTGPRPRSRSVADLRGQARSAAM